MINNQGSVRVDLLGGTLDIYPINVILPQVKTLNMATNLMASVEIMDSNESVIEFVSHDYHLSKSFGLEVLENVDDHLNLFGPFEFMARILSFFRPTHGMKIIFSSGAPTGSGLGGSSAMGAVFFDALNSKFSRNFEPQEIVRIVQTIESKILNAGPAGYQDYYPSLYGGILSLNAGVEGVKVEQLYTTELADFLTSNTTLIYSGESRQSGINNWEVYKSFFDKKEHVVKGLQEINHLANKAYQNIKSENYDELILNIKAEGEIRENLFPTILTTKMKDFKSKLQTLCPKSGIKVCGAGGGGCFLVTDVSKINLNPILNEFEMRKLDFSICHPLEK